MFQLDLTSPVARLFLESTPPLFKEGPSSLSPISRPRPGLRGPGGRTNEIVTGPVKPTPYACDSSFSSVRSDICLREINILESTQPARPMVPKFCDDEMGFPSVGVERVVILCLISIKFSTDLTKIPTETSVKTDFTILHGVLRGSGRDGLTRTVTGAVPLPFSEASSYHYGNSSFPCPVGSFFPLSGPFTSILYTEVQLVTGPLSVCSEGGFLGVPVRSTFSRGRPCPESRTDLHHYLQEK